MNRPKTGDFFEYEGDKYQIYDLCWGCRLVWAKSESGIKSSFRIKDGKFVLKSRQNESEADKAVREGLTLTKGK